MSSNIKPIKAVPDAENTESDGRRLRSERSREKIVIAMIDLILAGDVDPSANAIAEKAGIGLRSVFRHFEDMDSIHREVIHHLEREITPLFLKPYTTTNWQDQLFEAIDRKAEISERIMFAYIAGAVRRFKSDVLMDDFKRSTMKELAIIEAILPAEHAKNKALLMSLDIAISTATWYRLRHDRNLTVNEAKATLVFSVKSILAQL